MQQMKQRWKGLAALVLAAVMVFTMIPMSAMATEEYNIVVCDTDGTPLNPEVTFTISDSEHSGELPELPDGAFLWKIVINDSREEFVKSKDHIYEFINDYVGMGKSISSCKLVPKNGDLTYQLLDYDSGDQEYILRMVDIPQGMKVAELSADTDKTGYSLAENEAIIGWNLWKSNSSGKVYTGGNEFASEKVKLLENNTVFTGADYNQAYNCQKADFMGYFTKQPTLEPVYHAHVRSAEWQTDSKKHWHVCASHMTYIYRGNDDTKEQQTDYHCAQVFDEAAHTWDNIYEKNAQEHWKQCSVCGYPLEDKQAHTWDGGVITTPATAEKEGVKVYTCTVCKQTKTEVVPKTAQPKPTTPTVQSLSKAQMTGISSKTYNGKVQTQSGLKVTCEGKTLTQGKDYTVSYKNNVNAGTATVTVTGIGNYKDSKSASFTIKKASQSISKVSESYTKAYKSTFTLKAKAKGKISYKSSDTKVATVNSKGKVSIKGTGKVTITVKAKATSCYKSATKTVTIYAVPAKTDLTKVKGYKGKVKVEWKKDSKASGYQVLYSTNKNMKKAKTVDCAKRDTTATIKKLKKDKTCYVKVRAYKTIDGKKYYGAYSDKMSAKVK